MRITNDFSVLRPLWLAVQGLGFLAVAFALCRWVGGPRGRLAAWLIPAVWVAVPTLQNFAFGQFHLSAIALAVAGMLAFEMRRTSLGGALLGAAVVTKLYPAVLLLLLVSQQRWRELAVTLTWIAAFAILGLALFGSAPYQAFLFDHLPRLLDGSAFDSPHWDETAKKAMVAINLGVSAIPDRLRLLGVELLPAQLGPWLGRAFGLVILALVWRAGRRETSRVGAPILWLALLNLVVLQGPAAFVDYVPVTSLWLLTFVSSGMARNRATAIGLGICWLHFATLFGTFPIPDDMSEDWTEAISLAQVSTSTLLMTLFVLALNLWYALRTDLDLDRQASLEALAEPGPAEVPS